MGLLPFNMKGIRCLIDAIVPFTPASKTLMIHDTHLFAMFEITHRDTTTAARRGKLTTAHGIVDTPAFMPVATKATVKTLTPDDLYASDVQMIISNAFHLFLAPGIDIIKKAGGLHKFMNYTGGADENRQHAIFTDSGGFQIIPVS